jgi:hypothetical protein
LNLATVLSVSFLFRTRDRLNWLMATYLYSFAFVAAFGILQFIAGVFDWDLLLQDRFFSGLPRVNGFSFEPSYFATYMLTGLAFALGLLATGSKAVNRRILSCLALTMAVAIVLSTSRIGWAMLALLCAGAVLAIALVGNRPFTLGVWLRSKALIIGPIFAVSVFAVAIWLVVASPRLDFIFEGTGIDGQAAHSREGRLAAIESTIEVFKKNPLAGVSLGGVGPAVAEVEGRTDRDAEGINVFAEVLAASGIIGAPFFFAGLLLMIGRPILSLGKLPPPDAYVLFSLTLAAVVVLVMLQFNQNILRTYVWIHFAILGAAFLTYTSAEDSRDETTIIETGRPA